MISRQRAILIVVHKVMLGKIIIALLHRHLFCWINSGCWLTDFMQLHLLLCHKHVKCENHIIFSFLLPDCFQFLKLRLFTFPLFSECLAVTLHLLLAQQVVLEEMYPNQRTSGTLTWRREGEKRTGPELHKSLEVILVFVVCTDVCVPDVYAFV